MQAYTAPPVTNASPDRPEDVRAVLFELRARLEVVRRWYPDVLGDPTHGPLRYVELGGTFAFMLLVPLALVWAAFSNGTLWIGLAGTTAVIGLGVLAITWPSQLRARKWRREAAITTFAVVDVDPMAFDPTNENQRACHGVLSFDPRLEEHPRKLVAIADAIRAALAGADTGRDPELQRFVDEIRPRIARRRVRAPAQRVPDALAGGAEVRFVELPLSPNLLPAGRLDARLIFVLAHPRDAAGDMLGQLHSGEMWGSGGNALSRAFPLAVPGSAS